MKNKVIWEDIPTWVNHEKEIVCYTPVKSGHSTIYNILLDNGFERISKDDIEGDHPAGEDYSVCPYYDRIWGDKPVSWHDNIQKPLVEILGYEDYTSYLFVRHPVSRFFSGLFTELDNSAVTMMHNICADEKVDLVERTHRITNMFSALIQHFWNGFLDRLILPVQHGQQSSHCWLLSRDLYEGKSIYDYVHNLVSFDTTNDAELKSSVMIENTKQLRELGIVDDIDAKRDFSENPTENMIYNGFFEAINNLPDFLEDVEGILWEECVHIKCNEWKFLGQPAPTPLLHLMNNMNDLDETESHEEVEEEKHTNLTRREKVLLDPLSASQNKSSE